MPTGLVLKLYREHFGVVPVTVSGQPEPLDVVAAWSDDRQTLTVAVVNPTRDGLELAVDIKGVTLTVPGRLWRITGQDELAYNEPGQEPRVRVEETAYDGPFDHLEARPISVSLYSFPVR